MNVQYECTDCRSLARGGPPGRPLLKKGTLIAAMRLAYDGPRPDVTLTVTPSPAICLEDGREVTNLLGDIHDAVSAHLKDPTIAGSVPG
jgi:hypothetical protein